jgi:hypothetical protein
MSLSDVDVLLPRMLGEVLKANPHDVETTVHESLCYLPALS